MKKILLLTLIMGVMACENRRASEEIAKEPSTDANVVEVLYFHGKQRCLTCRAIEMYARQVVDSAFADQVNRGEVVFRAVDITREEALADKYEISWSSLVIVDKTNSVETAENMTEFAFANARKSPDVFKKGVTEVINKMLND